MERRTFSDEKKAYSLAQTRLMGAAPLTPGQPPQLIGSPMALLLACNVAKTGAEIDESIRSGEDPAALRLLHAPLLSA